VSDSFKNNLQTTEDVDITNKTYNKEPQEGAHKTHTHTTPFKDMGNHKTSSALHAINHETSINNAVANLASSRKRRVKAELEIRDAYQQNDFREQLKYQAITPLPRGFEVCAEFPINALPDELAQLTEEVARSLQVPLEAVGSTAIGAVTIAARGKYQIHISEEHIEALTNYMLIGMPSGSRKSAIVSFFRRPFEDAEKAKQASYDQDSMTCELQKNVLKTMINDVKRRALKELASQDALKREEIAAIVAEEMRPYQALLNKSHSRPRYLLDSPTPKKLAEVMQQQDEAIGIMEAEGGLWKNRVRPNEDDILLKGYTMEPFSNETSTAKSVRMRAPCLTICSLVQMEVIETLYSKNKLKEHGVLPRILPTFATWRGGPKRADAPEIPEQSVIHYEETVRRLLDTCPVANTADREVYSLSLSNDARDALKTFEQKVNSLIHEGRFANFESFGEKLTGHAIRLAGTIHLWQHDAPNEHAISEISMKGGIDLACYYTQHAMAAFDLERLQALKFARKILKWHERYPRSDFTIRQAQRGIGRCSAQEIQSGADMLERHGMLGQYLTTTHSHKCIMNPNYPPHQFAFNR